MGFLRVGNNLRSNVLIDLKSVLPPYDKVVCNVHERVFTMSIVREVVANIRKRIEATPVPLEVHFAIAVSLVNGVPKASMLSDLPKVSSTTRVEC